MIRGIPGKGFWNDPRSPIGTDLWRCRRPVYGGQWVALLVMVPFGCNGPGSQNAGPPVSECPLSRYILVNAAHVKRKAPVYSFLTRPNRPPLAGTAHGMAPTCCPHHKPWRRNLPLVFSRLCLPPPGVTRGAVLPLTCRAGPSQSRPALLHLWTSFPQPDPPGIGFVSSLSLRYSPARASCPGSAPKGV
jgi:hypothetical protein